MKARIDTRFFIFLLVWIGLSGCIDTPSPEENSSSIVVEGYLYTGQPVDRIRLSETVGFTAENTDPVWVNNATVSLSNGANSFPLVPSPGDSGFYHYPDPGLILMPGDSWSLSVEVQGQLLEAETSIPEVPTGLESDVAVVEIPPIYDMMDLRNRNLVDINLNWDNPNQDWYYVLIENTEENPSPIDVNGIFEDVFGEMGRRFSFIAQPTQTDGYQIRSFSLSNYGLYRVVLFRVNEEYADLYEDGEQDSRNLTEPLTNITNGYGIFTAFSSDTITFRVSK